MSEQKREVAVTLVDPDKKVTFIFNLGSIQDLADQELENYREETKCFHMVFMGIKIDYALQQFEVDFHCLECAQANLTKEVLT